MIRRLCMGQNKKLQDIFRMQSLNKVSYNFLDEAIKYQIVLEPELKEGIQKGDFVLVEAAIRGFLMLADSMHGPNYSNQESIAIADFFDLCDRILHKIRFEEIDKQSSMGRRKSMAQVLPQEVTEEERNAVRSRLKLAVISCSFALLEGVQGEMLPQRMITTVSWAAMVFQMNSCFELHDKRIGIPADAIVSEGSLYYFVMRFVIEYDQTGTIQAALVSAPAAVKFYEQRTGYVEIQREGRLERIYFQLPGKCVAGGALDKEYAEMFETEREDPDKKNQGFLKNLCKIVAREEFQSRLRRTWFAFAIDHWGLICRSSYLWVFLMHAVMVLGSYPPNSSLSGLSARQLFKNESSLSSATVNERYFFQTVVPSVQEITRYMCWANLLLCSIRFLSFMIAHVPVIIMEMRENEKDIKDSGDLSTFLEASPDGDNEEEEEEEVGDQMMPEVEISQPKTRRPWSRITKRIPRSSQSGFLSVLASGYFIYETIFFACGLAAAITNGPLFTIFAFFEVFYFNSSKTVVDAMKFKAVEMFNTFIIGLVFMYIWMVLGMIAFEDIHQDGDGNYICINMFQCFMAYFFIAMRGDGVRDVTTSPTFPSNVVDALAYPSFFLVRVVWDLLYQVLHVPAAAEADRLAVAVHIRAARHHHRDRHRRLRRAARQARDSRERLEVHLLHLQPREISDRPGQSGSSSLERGGAARGGSGDVWGGTEREGTGGVEERREHSLHSARSHSGEQNGSGFDKHIQYEHNPRWYLFFLLYIKSKPNSYLTGQEKFVKNQATFACLL
eukprot:748658-Hanusia_phi.AAC.4